LTQQQPRQRYSFDIRVGTTNFEEPVTQIDKVVIAYDLDTVIEYCKNEYNMDGMEETVSDMSSVVFEKYYLAQISDHGNLNEISGETEEQILDNYGDVKEEYQEQYGRFRDVVDICGGEITQKDYEYMISGKYWNRVLDLTEKSN
jgi:hypothetical protein